MAIKPAPFQAIENKIAGRIFAQEGVKRKLNVAHGGSLKLPERTGLTLVPAIAAGRIAPQPVILNGLTPRSCAEGM